LLGEGIMRDLARRVQALRKEMGFVPTETLESVHIAELDAESMGFLEPYLEEMSSLVRARKVYLHSSCTEIDAKWHESELDGRKIQINIH
jgi:isoleucyl-tRNA synthetase